MEYCNLGRSGLQVARLGLGAIPFGTGLDEDECRRIVDMYAELGGNYIDTANTYGGGVVGQHTAMAGTSERTVGKAIKGKRHRFVVATKGYWTMDDKVQPNGVGLSRTYLTTQIEASLRRFDTDYIDLYQCHCWDFYTPIEETLRVLDDAVRAGKIRYVGASNFEGWHVVKANAHARSVGLSPVISNQIWYNLADRGAENTIVPACRDQGASTIAWGALAQGFLTGKYRRGSAGPAAASRMAGMNDAEMASWQSLATERNWALLDRLSRIAEEKSQTIANVALRWLLQGGACDAVLLGAFRYEHLVSNLGVLGFSLSAEEVAELRQASEPPHYYPRPFYELFCRRESPWYGGLR